MVLTGVGIAASVVHGRSVTIASIVLAELGDQTMLASDHDWAGV